jgi:hypothetical protein
MNLALRVYTTSRYLKSAAELYFCQTLEDLYLRHRNYDPETPLISRASQYDFWLSLRVLEATTVMWSLSKLIQSQCETGGLILPQEKCSCGSAL